MKKIWKYELPLPSESDGVSVVALPDGAEVLSVQTQGEAIVLWALCDTDDRMVRRGFRVVGTGWVLPDDGEVWHYRATVQMGRLVWHVWEQG